MRKYNITYIWTDNLGNFREKTRMVDLDSTVRILAKHIPSWNYDGSSTGQAQPENSEVLLMPCAVYTSNDPTSTKILALCETYLYGNGNEIKPHPDNNRFAAIRTFQKYDMMNANPWFGIEQEFFITDAEGKPLGFNANDEQGRFYCSVGTGNNYVRSILEEIVKIALNFRLNIVGHNTEVAPGQAEIQLLSTDIGACDDLVMLRYLMIRTAENHNLKISFHPKPLGADTNWNGSGGHVNFSTSYMRGDATQNIKKEGDENNTNVHLEPYDCIMHAICQLSDNHEKHISVYGKDNHLRLTGKHETSSMTTFTYGIADRSASIRIPRETFNNKKGYIEDRRPASNFDAYLVLPLIYDTCMTGLCVTF